MAAETNVLIYEDDEACGVAFASILRHAGYRVFLSSHFDPALKALEGQQVDLLVADIAMPAGGAHGIALARMARMRNSAIAVVYVTGYDVPGGLKGELLLRKPVTDDQLLSAVAAALRKDA